MGGKTSTTSQSVSIPPDVLARYNAVNARAETAAATPFQQYSTDPNAFVAGLSDTQNLGIQNTNGGAAQAQPYYQIGTGLTLNGAQSVNPTDLNGASVNKYLSPYLQTVLGTTMAAQGQQNAQQQQGLNTEAIKGGAFGGDRAGIAQANLAYQQNLANSQTNAGILNTGYNQALGTAQQQQGVDLQAQQANAARLMQAGQQVAGLGTGAQQATLQGAQAQIAAGAQQQQTQQAGLSALYNQFLQQQGYPFQTAQFLANIAEGTGALSGSTTTTTQSAPFFSDERLKDDIQKIGETYDGQNIIKFRYKGSPHTQIGLSAQDVEKHHPEAVGLAGGYKTVDYDAATEHAANRGRYYAGGLAASGYAFGGGADDTSMFGGAPYGTGGPSGGLVPSARFIPVGGGGGHSLMVAGPVPKPLDSGLSSGLANAKNITDLAEKGKSGFDWLKKNMPSFGDNAQARGGLVGYADGGDVGDEPEGLYNAGKSLPIPNEKLGAGSLPKPGQAPGAPQGIGSTLKDAAGLANSAASIGSSIMEFLPAFLARGGLAGGRRYADGGDVAPNQQDDPAIFDDMVNRGLGSIKGIESSGRYGIVGPAAPSGDRPHGAYQVMGANIGPWTQEALGKRLSPQEFLADPQAQDAVARHKFGQYIAKTGDIEDAASMWFSGQPVARAGNAADVLGTTVPQYINRFRKGYGADNGGLSPDTPMAYAPSGDNRGLSGGSPSPVSSGSPENDNAPQSPGGQISRGLGALLDHVPDKLKDPGFVVPLLSFLGTMASSNSTHLGSAILQGLGGGAQAYQQQQLQNSQIAKNNLELVQKRFQPLVNGNFYDTVAGREVSAEERLQALSPYVGTVSPRAPVAQSSAPSGGLSGDAGAAVPRPVSPSAPNAPGLAPSAPSAPSAALSQTPGAGPQSTAPDNGAPSSPPSEPPSTSTEALARADADPVVSALHKKADDFESRADALLREAGSVARKTQVPNAQSEAARLSQESTQLRAIAQASRVQANTRRDMLAQPDLKRLETLAVAEANAKARWRYDEQARANGMTVLPDPNGPNAPNAPVSANPSPQSGAPAQPDTIQIDPKTAKVLTAIPAPPQNGGGGFPVPKASPGERVSKYDNENQKKLDEDYLKDIQKGSVHVDIAATRLRAMAQAFKLVQSGATTDRLTGLAAIADAYGFHDIAKKVLNGDVAAAQWIDKNGVNLVLESLKAATQRFTQSEFNKLNEKGVPTVDNTPQANHNMISEALGTVERSRAFMRDWKSAQQQGWSSVFAFWDAWSDKNPLSAFQKSADREIGNFKGMNLPPSQDWAEGTIYSVPKNIDPKQAQFLSRFGVAPGGIFRFNGKNAQTPVSPIRPEDTYTAHLGTQ